MDNVVFFFSYEDLAKKSYCSLEEKLNNHPP